MVVHAKAMGPHFTFFVVYGKVNHLVDLGKVTVVEREFPALTPKECNARIKAVLHRPLVVVGACIGTDAHTVGIDAILNVKGWAGEKGLEAYGEFDGREPGRPDGCARPGQRGHRAPGATPCSSRRSSRRRTPTSTT